MCFPTPDIDRVMRHPQMSKELTAELLSASQFLVFDTGRAPWTDARVRQAFNLAIDREKVVRALSRGLFKPTKVLVPPGIQGYDPGHALQMTAADAGRLLAEAGRAGGPGVPQFTLAPPAIRRHRALVRDPRPA